MNFWTNVAGNPVIHIYNLEQLSASGGGAWTQSRRRSATHLARATHRSESHTPKRISPLGINFLCFLVCILLCLCVFTHVWAHVHRVRMYVEARGSCQESSSLLFTCFFEVKCFSQARSLLIRLVLQPDCSGDLLSPEAMGGVWCPSGIYVDSRDPNSRLHTYTRSFNHRAPSPASVWHLQQPQKAKRLEKLS